eukprot:CAMPEP_0201517252 /NCGR_PEP_ID=MMETSP0161_2-20130828/8407_1 /ASSEMBLY_ACC=CAM_ASM_000251 /TAXON_ID=180227 /ORGANISM="Neoparamoeba aestuarina, Strain SoJaBio B1-5/56/2" /LENGTH=183 /DNA_ID=CAMNT_0047914697 /DNA_START=314 /DNA_END=865 /DNA_ORIENTATION=-
MSSSSSSSPSPSPSSSVKEAMTALGMVEGTCLCQTFSWVINSKMAGSSCPGNSPASLEYDLKILKQMGITCIVSLNEASIDTKLVESFEIRHVDLPVDDYRPPSIEQMVEFGEIVDKEERTLVHCNAGMGRTGTMLASYLIREGMPAQDAIKKLRKERKGSIQTFKQEDGLKAYQAYVERSIN